MGLKKTAAPPEEVVDSDCSILIVAYELMKMPCALLLVEATFGIISASCVVHGVCDGQDGQPEPIFAGRSGPLRMTETTGIIASLCSLGLVVVHMCRPFYPKVNAHSANIVLVHLTVSMTLAILFLLAFC
eukprot:gene15421-32378_t